MALTEEQIEDKIEVVGEHRIVQVRTSTIIKRDGVEISSSYSRHVVVQAKMRAARVQKFRRWLRRYIPTQ